MTTQVIFKIDKKLKDQAMKKAQKEGMAFSSVLQHATKAFVEGKLNVELVAQPQFNTKTKKIIDQALKDINAGKNLSPRFKTATELVEYLKNDHGDRVT